MLMQLENQPAKAELSFAASLLQIPNEAQAQPYFFIPPNDDLDQYWTRVADRLYKIRHGLNILGVQAAARAVRAAHQPHGPGERRGRQPVLPAWTTQPAR